MPDKPTSCAVCAEALEHPSVGRPTKYCCQACRRTAENDRARLGRHVSWLDKELVKAKIDQALAVERAGGHRGASVNQAKAKVAVLRRELRAAKQRLIDLRGDDHAT